MYSPKTKIRFGKYKGYTVEQILRIDAAYVLWLQDKIPNFKLDKEAFKVFVDKHVEQSPNIYEDMYHGEIFQ